jgi:hypothetical protein
MYGTENSTAKRQNEDVKKDKGS